MKHFFLAAVLALVLGAGGISYAQTMGTEVDQTELEKALHKNEMRRSPMYQSLTAADNAGGFSEVEKAVKESLGNYNKEESDAILQWLEDRTFGRLDPNTFNIFFFRMYSEVKTLQAYTASRLGRAEEQKEAATTALRSLMVYELVGLADAARCGDISVDEAVRKDVTDRFRALSFTLKIIPKEQYDLGAIDAGDIEEKTKERPLDINLCKMGKVAKDQKDYRPPSVPSTWDTHREYLRKFYKNEWSSRYYDLSKR